MKFKREDFFSIPNILTYIRILLIPLFCVVYSSADNWVDHLWAVGIVCISGATDVIDGYIARHWNMITDWGKIIDPIADKAMQAAMMFSVVVKYHWVAVLIVLYAIKEFSSLALSAYLFKKGKTIGGANWYGKLCTVVLFCVMFSLILFPEVPVMIQGILIGVSAAFMVLAFILYMNEYIKLYAELKQEQADGTYEKPGQMFFIRKQHPDDNGNADTDLQPADKSNANGNSHTANNDNVNANSQTVNIDNVNAELQTENNCSADAVSQLTDNGNADAVSQPADNSNSKSDL